MFIFFGNFCAFFHSNPTSIEKSNQVGKSTINLAWFSVILELIFLRPKCFRKKLKDLEAIKSTYRVEIEQILFCLKTLNSCLSTLEGEWINWLWPFTIPLHCFTKSVQKRNSMCTLICSTSFYCTYDAIYHIICFCATIIDRNWYDSWNIPHQISVLHQRMILWLLTSPVCSIIFNISLHARPQRYAMNIAIGPHQFENVDKLKETVILCPT